MFRDFAERPSFNFPSLDHLHCFCHIHFQNMTSALTPTLPRASPMSATVMTGFRLGEDDLSDASDSDQSVASERSLPPTPPDAEKSTEPVSRKTRSKRRRELRHERKQVRSLTDDLGSLLGDAFQDPSATTADRGKNTNEKRET